MADSLRADLILVNRRVLVGRPPIQPAIVKAVPAQPEFQIG